MNIRTHLDNNSMLLRLFVKLLSVQVAIVAMSSVNSIVDGIVAARYINATTVGVIGLYYTVLRILEAVGSVLLGGTTVLGGRYLGKGQIDRARGILSLGLVLAFLFGALLTVLSFAIPGTLADLLGADSQLKAPLSAYIQGYAIGILPQLLGQQFASSLQLEQKGSLGHIAIAVMITCNLFLDVLFVVVLNLGVGGLALATSLANWAYCLVVMQYYVTRKAQLGPSLKLIRWSETPAVIRTGFPGAVLAACLGARSLVLNRLLLSYSGSDGLSAMSSFNLIVGLILAIAIGTGAVIRMLASVFLGEDNRESLRALIRIAGTYLLIAMVALAVVVIALSSFLTGLFYTDTASQVYQLTKQLIIIYSCGIPAALICVIFSSYFQAAGHRVFVNLISVMDGFFSSVIPALVLAPRMGATGVWLSFLIGLFITLGLSVLYPIVRSRHIPRTLDEWLLLPPEFGSGKHLVLNLNSMKDVSHTAENVQLFCNENRLPGKIGVHAGLCLEEIAGNIVRFGFNADHRKHSIEVRVVLQQDSVVLRIKDDCKPFNPQKWYEMTTPGSDPSANVGIRLVYAIADKVEYQNMLGLNVLTIIQTCP